MCGIDIPMDGRHSRPVISNPRHGHQRGGDVPQLPRRIMTTNSEQTGA